MRATRWLAAGLMAVMAGPMIHAQSAATASAPAGTQTDAAANSTAAAKPKQSADPKVKDAYKPLLHAHLVVWLVEPSGAGPTIVPPGNSTQAPLTYQERTTGAFGQNASTYGTDAASYGVDASSRKIARQPDDTGPDADADAAAKAGYKERTSGGFGQNAAGYGTDASNHGQTAGSYGQTAGNYGIDAGNYGTDASNYGVNASDFGHSNQNGRPATQTAAATVPFANQLQNSLTTTFPALKVRYVDVGSNDVKARLREAAAGQEYPDVVILDGFATSWPGFPQDVRDALLPTEAPEAHHGDRKEDRLPPTWYVTRHAPHTTAAHALSVYLVDTARAAASGQH